jgi:hypothetical protein
VSVGECWFELGSGGARQGQLVVFLVPAVTIVRQCGTVFAPPSDHGEGTHQQIGRWVENRATRARTAMYDRARVMVIRIGHKN